MAKGNVFLVACDPEYYERSVGSPVDLTGQSDTPAPIEDQDAVRVWGVPEGSNNNAYYEKMNPGDLVLFHTDDTYVGVGWVDRKFVDVDQWASTTLWDDTPHYNLFTVRDFAPVRVAKPAVNRIFDYDAGYNPPEFMRVADRRVTNQSASIKRAIEKYDQKHATAQNTSA